MKVRVIIGVCLIVLASCRSVHHDIPAKGYYESSLQGYNANGRDYLNFHENNFELIRLSDVENSFGTGVYEVINDSMIFTFENLPTSFSPKVQYEKLDGKDSIRLEVKVTEFDSDEPFERANILLKNTRRGAYTDNTGKAILSLLKSELVANDTLSVFFLGYNTQLIPISPKLGDHQIINVSLASGLNYFQAGEILRYSIKQNKSGFSLGTDGTEVPFRRIRKGVFDKVLNELKAKK